MKIYIAGKLSQREQLHGVRERLWKLGFDVVSAWMDDHSTGFGGDNAMPIALRDLEWIAQCDVLILDTTHPLSLDAGGGREFEFGFALGKKQVWRVGPKKSAFHALVTREFHDWEHFFLEMKEEGWAYRNSERSGG